jgi:hypothetical protein
MEEAGALQKDKGKKVANLVHSDNTGRFTRAFNSDLTDPKHRNYEQYKHLAKLQQEVKEMWEPI